MSGSAVAAFALPFNFITLSLVVVNTCYCCCCCCFWFLCQQRIDLDDDVDTRFKLLANSWLQSLSLSPSQQPHALSLFSLNIRHTLTHVHKTLARNCFACTCSRLHVCIAYTHAHTHVEQHQLQLLLTLSSWYTLSLPLLCVRSHTTLAVLCFVAWEL